MLQKIKNKSLIDILLILANESSTMTEVMPNNEPHKTVNGKAYSKIMSAKVEAALSCFSARAALFTTANQLI